MILKKGDHGPFVVLLQKALGITADGIFGQKTFEAVKIYQSVHNLTVDGIVGPNTIASLKAGNGPTLPPIIPPIGGVNIDPPWLVGARKDLGVQEKKPGNTGRILQYHSHTSLGATTDEVAWCASAGCCWLEEAGLKSPRNAWAQSFAASPLFEHLSRPIHGCFVCYRWNADSGHLNIYDANSSLPFGCIGGNQADNDSGGEVTIADYSQRQSYVLAYLWPKEYPKPGAVTPSPGPVLDSSEYGKLYASMVIRSDWLSRAGKAADLVLAGRVEYEKVSAAMNIPWYLIGCIHLMEGNCDFKTHLHNGDPLSARTKHVPSGRPIAGSPPFTWQESAVDALAYDGIKPPLETIGQQFGALERFNGMGYRGHGINTPYLWSGSNHYSQGKYVSDGHWSSSAVSEQVGAACVYKILEDRGIIKV